MSSHSMNILSEENQKHFAQYLRRQADAIENGEIEVTHFHMTFGMEEVPDPDGEKTYVEKRHNGRDSLKFDVRPKLNAAALLGMQVVPDDTLPLNVVEMRTHKETVRLDFDKE